MNENDVVIPDLSSKLEIVIATNGAVYVMKIGLTYFLVMQKRTVSVPGIYKAVQKVDSFTVACLFSILRVY